jgi:hypothetical protein
MTKSIQKLVLALAALAAMAFGAAGFAQAQGSSSAAPERVSAPDRDSVQSGDQTTPDKARAASETPGSENTSESAPSNDGPGGHADEPGNANADHQFQGNE